MTQSYTLHVAAAALPGDRDALERATLVRDGFAWGALVSPTLWFVWHRHWLLGLAALAVGLALAGGLWAAGAGAGTIGAAGFLLNLLFSLEGPSLRRFAYARRGRPERDLVMASDMLEAETKGFARWLAPPDDPHRPAHAAARAPFRAASEPVIGLFPDAEGRQR